MRNLLFCSLLILFISSSITAQEDEEVKEMNTNFPKGNWFFGAEVGHNLIASYKHNEDRSFFQAGLMAEYFFSRQWAAQARLKYFNTGVSFYNGGYGNFSGSVISIPINIKWEFRIFEGLTGHLKTGAAFNYEVKSIYDFPEDMETNYDRFFVSFNNGVGFSYYFSPKTAAYIDLEAYNIGGHKGHNGWFRNYTTTNHLLNIGIKYNPF